MLLPGDLFVYSAPDMAPSGWVVGQSSFQPLPPVNSSFAHLLGWGGVFRCLAFDRPPRPSSAAWLSLVNRFVSLPLFSVFTMAGPATFLVLNRGYWPLGTCWQGLPPPRNVRADVLLTPRTLLFCSCVCTFPIGLGCVAGPVGSLCLACTVFTQVFFF